MPIDNSMAFQRLDIYIAAKEIARLVNEARITHSELRDQAQRASVSCFLQLAEGLPNDGPGMRRKYFTESHNSLHELVAAVDLACPPAPLSPAPPPPLPTFSTPPTPT